MRILFDQGVPAPLRDHLGSHEIPRSPFGMVRKDQGRRHGLCAFFAMESGMIGESKRTESALPDIERECEAWDWARTAGVSAEELREAVRVLAGSEDPKRSVAEAA